MVGPNLADLKFSEGLLMTTHFLLASTESTMVSVSRSFKGTWRVSVPLPSGIEGTLPDLSGSFGFPVTFTCLCSSMGSSCACSHEVVYGFWRSLSEFVYRVFNFGQSHSHILDSIRKRFVKFYVDLPVWELSFGNDTKSPCDIRNDLIREACGFAERYISSSCKPLRWAMWPSDPSICDDGVFSRLFTSDIQVLSEIRHLTEQASFGEDIEGGGIDHFFSLVGSTWDSPLAILQAASVLDQINLVDISAHTLSFFKLKCFETDQAFLLKINSTLSDRNEMKWKFLPQATTSVPEDVPDSKGLDKFRSKLAKLILYKQRSRRGTYRAYSPVYASDSDDNPVETYLTAKRQERKDGCQKEESEIHPSESIIQPPVVDDLDSSHQSSCSDGYELVAEYFGPLYQGLSKLPKPTNAWAAQAHRDLDQYIHPN